MGAGQSRPKTRATSSIPTLAGLQTLISRLQDYVGRLKYKVPITSTMLAEAHAARIYAWSAPDLMLLTCLGKDAHTDAIRSKSIMMPTIFNQYFETKTPADLLSDEASMDRYVAIANRLPPPPTRSTRSSGPEVARYLISNVHILHHIQTFIYDRYRKIGVYINSWPLRAGDLESLTSRLKKALGDDDIRIIEAFPRDRFQFQPNTSYCQVWAPTLASVMLRLAAQEEVLLERCGRIIYDAIESALPRLSHAEVSAFLDKCIFPIAVAVGSKVLEHTGPIAGNLDEVESGVILAIMPYSLDTVTRSLTFGTISLGHDLFKRRIPAITRWYLTMYGSRIAMSIQPNRDEHGQFKAVPGGANIYGIFGKDKLGNETYSLVNSSEFSFYIGDKMLGFLNDIDTQQDTLIFQKFTIDKEHFSYGYYTPSAMANALTETLGLLPLSLSHALHHGPEAGQILFRTLILHKIHQIPQPMQAYVNKVFAAITAINGLQHRRWVEGVLSPGKFSEKQKELMRIIAREPAKVIDYGPILMRNLVQEVGKIRKLGPKRLIEDLIGTLRKINWDEVPTHVMEKLEHDFHTAKASDGKLPFWPGPWSSYRLERSKVPGKSKREDAWIAQYFKAKSRGDINDILERIQRSGSLWETRRAKIELLHAIREAAGDILYANIASKELLQLFFEALRQSNSIRDIRKLSISDQIGDEEAIQLAELLAPNTALEWLNLSDNSFEGKGMAAIAKMLDNKPKLELLELSDVRIGRDGAMALSASLALTRVEMLNLGGFKSMTDDGVAAIVRQLRLNPNIKELDLGYTAASIHRAAHEIANLMETSTSLQTLNLISLGIDAADSKVLAHGLAKSKSLKELHLNHNHIDSDALEAWAQAIRENKSLTRIGIFGNPFKFDSKGIHMLADAIESNHTLKSIMFGHLGENESLPVVQRIYAAVKRNSQGPASGAGGPSDVVEMTDEDY